MTKLKNTIKNNTMELVRWIKPSRKDTLKYTLIFDFGYEECELVGLTTKELGALVVALRCAEKCTIYGKPVIDLSKND